MKKNVVPHLRVPSCAKIKKVISCPKHGPVAATLTWNGNEITFFRTDFLEFSRVAWYDAEKFSAKHYHEELPDKVVESIQKNGGFFLSKHFMTFMLNGKIMSKDVTEISKNDSGTVIRKVDFEKAKTLVSCIDVPGLKPDLMYGVIYDVLGKWLLETETLTEDEWLNSPEKEMEQQMLLKRDCGGWNLEELLGNIFVREWTQEKWGPDNYAVTRSGVPCSDGEGEYPSRMRFAYPITTCLDDTCIRAFFYFK